MENRPPSRLSFSPNSLVTLMLLGLMFFGGVWATRCFYQKNQTVSTENATVLLEQIKHVAKLITVEGYFSEVYDYKDYWGYDVSFLKKKALIRVKAKVSVGYDLNQLKVETFAEQKRIKISNLPKPQILSIDHTLDYYDITEGTFNSFSTDDYNRINQQAKDYVRAKAEESNLLQEAAKQGIESLDLIKTLAENMGWTVEIDGATNPTKN